MRKLAWIGLAAGIVLWFWGIGSAAEMMKPGLWEITTSMEMPGMPMQIPAQTMRHCYTEQEIREQPVPKDQNCKMTDLKTTGNKVSWKLECTGEMAGTGEGEIIHRGDSAYEGKALIRTQGMAMTTKYQGKRVGPCP